MVSAGDINLIVDQVDGTAEGSARSRHGVKLRGLNLSTSSHLVADNVANGLNVLVVTPSANHITRLVGTLDTLCHVEVLAILNLCPAPAWHKLQQSHRLQLICRSECKLRSVRGVLLRRRLILRRLSLRFLGNLGSRLMRLRRSRPVLDIGDHNGIVFIV